MKTIFFLFFLFFFESCSNNICFRYLSKNHEYLEKIDYEKKWCGGLLLQFASLPDYDNRVCIKPTLGNKMPHDFKGLSKNGLFKYIDSLIPGYHMVVNQSWFQAFKGLNPRQSVKLHLKRFERIKRLDPLFIPLYSYEFLVKINNKWFIYSTLTDQFYDDLYICGLFKWLPDVDYRITPEKSKAIFGDCDCFNDFYLRSNSVAYPKL
jgi:hypothetical protein